MAEAVAISVVPRSQPIRVFPRDGKWLVDYGSYVCGYHPTLAAAIEKATVAAQSEQRELLVEAA
jgi:hypothetical protein